MKKKNQTKNKKTYCDLGQSCYALKRDEPMFVFAAEHKTVKLPQTTHFLALFCSQILPLLQVFPITNGPKHQINCFVEMQKILLQPQTKKLQYLP